MRDNGKHSFAAPNLVTALDAANKNVIGYVETGSPREHNPWESFDNARKIERNLSELPNDLTQLPTVAFIIPNLNHDMHGRGWREWLKYHLHAIIPGLDHAIDEGWVRDGDTWLKTHLGTYAEWAKAQNSVLIVTFDEDDDHAGNHSDYYLRRSRPAWPVCRPNYPLQCVQHAPSHVRIAALR